MVVYIRVSVQRSFIHSFIRDITITPLLVHCYPATQRRSRL